ncbi:hypothetical protein Pcinc_012029 [Petrolisthes cinctipes]|uniref:Uncharacterized protein n=1 Tax=Petrolisthes cinctipes TaxID=88211 RepID=A0AAE1G1Q8_PETCI|nr:hypothetical protein Pcinc_012029 [Petrolisthes cinctipes]
MERKINKKYKCNHPGRKTGRHGKSKREKKKEEKEKEEKEGEEKEGEEKEKQEKEGEEKESEESWGLGKRETKRSGERMRGRVMAVMLGRYRELGGYSVMGYRDGNGYGVRKEGRECGLEMVEMSGSEGDGVRQTTPARLSDMTFTPNITPLTKDHPLDTISVITIIHLQST